MQIIDHYLSTSLLNLPLCHKKMKDALLVTINQNILRKKFVSRSNNNNNIINVITPLSQRYKIEHCVYSGQSAHWYSAGICPLLRGY